MGKRVLDRLDKLPIGGQAAGGCRFDAAAAARRGVPHVLL